mmetsp:Transcript_739/g.2612  ORF Transcript_739/g.2612 Transcript_739/m.2612 type:complete len:247 (+) Transcript_739:776-1516(+)
MRRARVWGEKAVGRECVPVESRYFAFGSTGGRWGEGSGAAWQTAQRYLGPLGASAPSIHSSFSPLYVPFSGCGCACKKDNDTRSSPALRALVITAHRISRMQSEHHTVVLQDGQRLLGATDPTVILSFRTLMFFSLAYPGPPCFCRSFGRVNTAARSSACPWRVVGSHPVSARSHRHVQCHPKHVAPTCRGLQMTWSRRAAAASCVPCAATVQSYVLGALNTALQPCATRNTTRKVLASGLRAPTA